MLVTVRVATQVGARPYTARRVRLRPIEQPGSVDRVADEHLGHAARVVEADEQLRHDEAALREPGPLSRERHGRLEARDDVVADVADDRPPERLGLREVDDPRAPADERVAPEPAPLHRLEQKGGAGAFAQPEE